MKALNNLVAESNWVNFIETLNDEFTSKSGKGMYAHISPCDVLQLYAQYQTRDMGLRSFARRCVRSYA